MAKLQIEQLGAQTYCIPAPTNIGIFVENGKALLIDSGNDKEAGRQINKLLNERGWELSMIINTHSNADHIGGNQFLQRKTGCPIAATEKERCFIEHPEQEAVMLYGGFPHKGISNKFLRAKPSSVDRIIPFQQQLIADTPLTAVPLPGHFLAMIGIMTPDKVFFTADALFSREIIEKYHFFYLHDIAAQLRTLDSLEKTGKNQHMERFIPSHGQPQQKIGELIRINRNAIETTIETILSLVSLTPQGKTLEELYGHLCRRFSISMNHNQYVLVKSCIRSYISYLVNEGALEIDYDDACALRLTARKPD